MYHLNQIIPDQNLSSCAVKLFRNGFSFIYPEINLMLKIEHKNNETAIMDFTENMVKIKQYYDTTEINDGFRGLCI